MTIGRGFVAVVPPDDVLDAIGAVAAGLELPAGARPTTRDQWHVTLQFLGRIDDVDAVKGALDDTIALLPPVRVRFGGAGAFPSADRGTLAFVDLEEGVDALRIVAAAVGGALQPLGFAPDDRPFRPHLTLARWKAPVDLRSVVAAVAAAPAGSEWMACDVVLFESRTLPSGAEHSALAGFELCG